MLTRKRTQKLITLIVAAITAVGLFASSTPQVQAAEPTFVIEGRGWGHGVGMSQNGAKNMADQGTNHEPILGFYYPNSIISKSNDFGEIRVHIGDAVDVGMRSQGSMTFEHQGSQINYLAAGTISVVAHDGGLQVGSKWVPAGDGNPVMVSFPQPVTLVNNNRSYLWGRFQLTNHNGKVRVVEVLDMEEYILGIAEMPASWHIQALMSQAIAARSYATEIALHRRNSAVWAQEYDISASTLDQNYIGYGAQDGVDDLRWVTAAKATAGVILVGRGGVIRAYYSASNGGYTESADYVFNNPVDYTPAKQDPYDAGGHSWSTWTRTYTQSQMSRYLGASESTNVGVVQAINVLGGRGASSRLDRAQIQIVGSAGTKTVSGKQLMLVINQGVIREGGGLSQRMLSTFATIGNGASQGLPAPLGHAEQGQVAAVDPNTDTGETDGAPVGSSSGTNTEQPKPATSTGAEKLVVAPTPPPGWTPVPGTGVAPREVPRDSDLARAALAEAGLIDQSAAPSQPANPANPANPDIPGHSAAANNPAAPNTQNASPREPERWVVAPTPPPGWTPVPGTGVAPREVPADQVRDQVGAPAVTNTPVPVQSAPSGAKMALLVNSGIRIVDLPSSYVLPSGDSANAEAVLKQLDDERLRSLFAAFKLARQPNNAEIKVVCAVIDPKQSATCIPAEVHRYLFG